MRDPISIEAKYVKHEESTRGFRLMLSLPSDVQEDLAELAKLKGQQLRVIFITADEFEAFEKELH